MGHTSRCPLGADQGRKSPVGFHEAETFGSVLVHARCGWRPPESGADTYWRCVLLFALPATPSFSLPPLYTSAVFSVMDWAAEGRKSPRLRRHDPSPGPGLRFERTCTCSPRHTGRGRHHSSSRWERAWCQCCHFEQCQRRGRVGGCQGCPVTPIEIGMR